MSHTGNVGCVCAIHVYFRKDFGAGALNRANTVYYLGVLS